MGHRKGAARPHAIPVAFVLQPKGMRLGLPRLDEDVQAEVEEFSASQEVESPMKDAIQVATALPLLPFGATRGGQAGFIDITCR